MTPEEKQKILESISKSEFNVKGDLVLEKHVEYEVNNVESGGTGIQIINGVNSNINEEDMDGYADENHDDNEGEQVDVELNYFAPTNSLQRLLSQKWFTEMPRDNKYDTAWTDAFVDALMNSEYGEGIARDWAVKGAREKKAQVRGYVVGLLKDAGVVKGSYRAIAAKVGIIVNEENKKDPYRTFADYMGRGKKQPYAQWVKGYVKENS